MFVCQHRRLLFDTKRRREGGGGEVYGELYLFLAGAVDDVVAGVDRVVGRSVSLARHDELFG